MYRPIRARNARYVCNVLVLFAFFTYALSNFSFLQAYISFVYVHALHAFFRYIYCSFYYCHMDTTCYFSSLLYILFFDLDIVIFLHLYTRACIARYVHNLLVIICFLFTCSHSIFPFCLTFHIVL